VAELVSDSNLSNAVALNSTSFQVARMVGPALAGLLIAGVGTGWIFSSTPRLSVGVLMALVGLARAGAHRHEPHRAKAGGFIEGLPLRPRAARPGNGVDDAPSRREPSA
jgi:predicted MFS family arabinose efflux permease